MRNLLKSCLTAGLAALILAFFVFAATMPRFALLTAAALLAELCVLYLYGQAKNAAFLAKVLCIELGCLLAFLLHWQLLGRAYQLDNLDATEWVLATAAFVGAAVIAVLTVIGTRAERKIRKDATNEAPQLFPERTHDLDRLKGFLEQGAPLIGVDSPWGDGKTFLLDHLCASLAADYEIVRIGVLAGHVNELETTLINEFDRILRRSRIFSRSSRQMLKLLESNSLLKQLRSLFVEDTDSVSETLDGILRDMAGLNKKVLIVVDDIERLGDERQIRKLFAMMERVSSPKLQVVYLYNHRRLNDDFDRDYLEKYIPCYMELTPIGFRSAVRRFWAELGMDATGMKCEDIEKLADYPDRSFSVMRILAADEFSEVRSFRLDRFQVRRVRSFLSEFRNLATQENGRTFARSEAERRLLLKCLFIKHFLPETFERFSIPEEVAEGFLFRLDTEKLPILTDYGVTGCVDVPLPDLFELRRRAGSYAQMQTIMATVLSDGDNYNQLIAAAMLNFDYMDVQKQIEAKESGQEKPAPARNENAFDAHIRILERSGNTDISQVEREQNNEQINRVMWNLLANGASEWTNLYAYVSHFQELVLDAAPERREEAWNTFRADAFNSNIYKDNTTCEKLAGDRFLPLFQGFRVTHANAARWLGLLDFYFSRPDQATVSVPMVQNLVYVDLTNHLVYLSVLRHFMQCEIKGNLNDDPCMSRFLKRILRMAASLGYVRGFSFERLYEGLLSAEAAAMSEDAFMPSKHWEDETMALFSQFPDLKTAVEKNKLGIAEMSWFDDDIQTIADFIDFCDRLIKPKNALKRPEGLQVTIEGSSASRHQELVNELEAQYRQGTVEEMYNVLRDAYQKGKLDPSEVRLLLGKIKN